MRVCNRKYNLKQLCLVNKCSSLDNSVNPLKNKETIEGKEKCLKRNKKGMKTLFSALKLQRESQLITRGIT